MFINLANEKVYCLPDDYEVEHRVFKDIKFNLNPKYTQEDIEGKDQSGSKQISFINIDNKSSRGLDGTVYYPGYIGLNNLGNTDFINVTLQTLCRVTPLRDYMLLYRDLSELKRTHNCTLAYRFAEIMRKIWNPKNFKGHVSPHEVVQAVSLSSKKVFTIGKQKDPISFFAWILNALSDGLKKNHMRVNHSKKLKSLKTTVIEETFQGELDISILKPKEGAGAQNNGRRNIDTQYAMEEETKKFLFLSLEVPPMPIFTDDSQSVTIPQIPLQALLRKFDGKNYYEMKGTTVKKKMKLKKLPKYLIFHIKRFSKNQFFNEKNHTIINIPLNVLDMKPYMDSDSQDGINPHRYMLISNIIHNGNANQGNYIVQVRYRPEDDTWYQIQDLHVTKIIPKQVAISESYVLIYERLPPKVEEVKEVEENNISENPSYSQSKIQYNNGNQGDNDPVIADETANNGLDDGEEKIIC